MMAASKTTRATAEAEALAAAAEAEAAEAEAQAAAARARAAALRSKPAARQTPVAAEASDGGPDVDAPEPDAELVSDTDTAEEPSRGFLRMPQGSTLALAAAVVVLCALLSLTGLMIWHHHDAQQRAVRQAEFSAAARQGVINLMSLDFTKGDQDIQRLIDSTTGSFRDDFQKSKNDFLNVMKDSKVVSQAEVKATGVQTMSDDSALVLVSAASQVSNSASAKQSPRAWRLAVTITRDGGQLKMSKVEFVP